MNKPSWFQPLTFIPAALASAAASYALVAGIDSESPTQATILLIAVPVLMWVITAILAYKRKKWLDSFTWFPRYGFMIDTNKGGYLLPAEDEFDKFVAMVAKSWLPFHPTADLILRRRVKWLYFRTGMNEKPMRGSWGLVNGVTVWGGSTLYVNYKTKFDTLESTAFDHELGHVIHGLATGGWSQDEHHAFAAKNGLR